MQQLASQKNDRLAIVRAGGINGLAHILHHGDMRAKVQVSNKAITCSMV